MKNLLTLISTLMVFVPWTILPIRKNPWALESPVAEIMIACYAVFMVFSGIFTIIAYDRAKAQSSLMKICLIINGLYGVLGSIIIIMMVSTKLM